MRYVVIGTSGSGKSTFAAALARARGCPYIELDRLHWGPGWTAVPPEAFEDAVRAATAAEHWVADGNYSAVRDLLWGRATHIIWLNFGRWTVWPRVVRRTLGRAIRRTELFNGNRESLRMSLLSTDSVILWSFTTFTKNRTRFSQLRQDPGFAHLHWTEVTTPSQAEVVMQALARDAC